MADNFTNIVTISNFTDTVEFTFESDSQKEAAQAFTLLCNIFSNGYGSPQLRDSKGNVLAVLVKQETVIGGASFIDSVIQFLSNFFKKVKGWFGL